jgi:ankyrin repeat protein
MEEYVSAFTSAIKYSFPDDIIKYIYQQLCVMNGGIAYDINQLWPKFYKITHSKEILALLNAGAHVDWLNPDTGSTPIMYLAQNCYKEAVLILLERGANLNIKNKIGQDVHHFANHSGLNMVLIIKEFQEKKEKEELLKRNKALEQQCLDMDDKLNYLLGALGKLNIEGLDNLTHKKCKAINEN